MEASKGTTQKWRKRLSFTLEPTRIAYIAYQVVTQVDVVIGP